MEQRILRACDESHDSSESLSLRSLASIRSLIINPSTSDSTLSSIIGTLTRPLQLRSDSYTHHHILKLLSDLSLHHTQFSRIVLDSLNSNSLLLSEPTLISTDALAALAFISDHNPNIVSEIDNQSFVSLCFSPNVSVRLWLLRNAERFCVRAHLLFTVFLGFTKDPYPLVRKVALDGLLALGKSSLFEDLDVIKGCYYRAIELLLDVEDYVRCAAVHVVSEWGQMLVRFSQEENRVAQMLQESDRRKNRTDLSDAVFLQLCSMVRDMSMEVRLAAFDALGKVGMASEDILLQTLSKKVLKFNKEKKFNSPCNEDLLQISASGAVGALMHGLEDEFFEVRKSACLVLHSFTILSEKFAGEASNLLVNMLNDDSVAVRLQALQTMHHMANSENLKLQEMHMDMFLGTLVDNSPSIRATARKILKLVKMPHLELFKLCIDGLLENLEIYPQDEVDVFAVLFYIGQSHCEFAVQIIEVVSHEIDPDSSSKLGFDNARVAAYLVLAISVPFSCEQKVYRIPPVIFSYAATMLGRISHALSDIWSRDSLLTYLSRCSRPSSCNGSELEGNDPSSHEGKIVDHVGTSPGISSASGIPAREICEASETQLLTLKEAAASHARCQVEKDDEIRQSMNLVLTDIKNTWPLIQSGCTDEALRTLRACKEEVLKFPTTSPGSDVAVAFTLQYLNVVKLLMKVWQHFVLAKFQEVGELEFLLGKLESRLREIRCRFRGLPKEEEFHVLELVLMTCLLRLTRVEMSCYLITVKRLSSIISQIEFLSQQGFVEPSKFVIGIKELLLQGGTSTAGTSCRSFLLNQLFDTFVSRQLSLGDGLKHIHAELDVSDNSSENPVLFVPGLPVAIPLEITLYNITSKNKLWVRMTIGEESTQFVYLDPNLLDSDCQVQKFTYAAPFYKTPNAVSFSLRICIVMECLFEEISLAKGHIGPKYMLANLSGEKEIYLSVASKG